MLLNVILNAANAQSVPKWVRDETVMDSQTFTTKLSTPTDSHEIILMKLMELSHGPVNQVFPCSQIRPLRSASLI